MKTAEQMITLRTRFEREREAFERVMVASGHADSADFIKSCREGNSYRAGFYRGAFSGWILAKNHAAEMAKPVAEVRKRKDHHQWAVYVPTSLTAEAYDFPHKEDAIAWAVERGYRVEQPT